MGHNQEQAFTIIELIMTMAIITILSAGGAYMLTFIVQSSVFIPNKLNMDMLASDAMDILIDGDAQAKGLRFSRLITDIQPNEVTFNNQDGQSIRYRLDAGTNRLYRSINSGPESLIPYYVPASGVAIEGNAGQIFTYYDTNNYSVITGNPDDVGRIEISVAARTGSGSFEDWDGETNLTSAIAVKQF